MKSIISLTVALTVIISILNISVCADDEQLYYSIKEYYAEQAYLFDEYCDGKISFDDYQYQSKVSTDRFLDFNSIDEVPSKDSLHASNTISGLLSRVGNAVSEWGDGSRERVSDWWNSVCNSNNVPTETTQTSTTDLMGAGALAKRYKDGVVIEIDACDYIVVNANGDRFTWRTNDGRPFTSYHYNANGSLSYINTAYENYSCYFYLSDGTYYKIYGDVRYEDGTQAPTDDEWEYGSIKKFDKMPEKDLEDLLNDFSEEMERQNPDLSSIEGLLRAIYARMGSLDSDNDNDLLSQINTSIQSLNASISDLSTSIETSINDLKETITSLFSNGDKKDDDNITIEEHEISGTLYNVIPLEKNWLQKITHDKTNLHVEYQGKEYYLESDGTLLLDGKYYNVDMNYASTLDEILYTLFDIRDSLELLTEEEKQMSFDDFFDLKVSDFKLDLDEKFAFKDNINDFIQNFLDEFNSFLPVYESGD